MLELRAKIAEPSPRGTSFRTFHDMVLMRIVRTRKSSYAGLEGFKCRGAFVYLDNDGKVWTTEEIANDDLAEPLPVGSRIELIQSST